MIPADWLDYMAQAEREQSQRPENAPAKPRPAKRLVSRRQRIVESQTNNTIKAMYKDESDWNATPIRSDTKGLTLNIGGNCEPDNNFHGKSTQSRT